MGLKNWLVKQLSEDVAQRNRIFLQSLYSHISRNFVNTGFQNIQQLIDEGWKRNVDVYSVVNWMAENAASVPLCVKTFNGEQWEKVENHPLQKLIDRPNPYQSGLEQRAQQYSFYLVTGNTFTYAPRIEAGVNQGQALEMWTMPSQDVEIISGGWMCPIKGFKLNTENSILPFRFDDVMHMKTVNLDYGDGREFWGMSPLRAGLLALDRSNSNYQYAASSFKNGGISGILQTEREEFDSRLTDEQREQAERIIQDNYKGVFNAGKTMVTNAETKWHQMGFSPVDLALLADKKATLRDICNIFGISSILFNDNENSTYNNVKEAKKSAYVDALIPMVERYTLELNNWLTPSYGEEVKVFADYSDIAVLQDDLKQLVEWTTRAIEGKLITPNEGREYISKPPIEEPSMDKIYSNMSSVPIEDLGFDITLPTEGEEKAIGKHYLEK